MAEIDDLLERLIDAEEPSDRQAVISKISTLGEPVIPAVLAFINRTELEERDRVDGILCLIYMTETAQAAILELMHHENSVIRGNLWSAMDEWGGEIEPFHDEARKALSDPEPQVRRKAIQWLSRHEVQDAAPQIALLLRDPDDSVRSAAAETLENTRFSRVVVPILIELLSDPVADVRSAAARTLSFLHDPAAVPALIAVLNDPNPMVRLEVISALGACRSEDGMKALLKLVAESSVNAPNIQAIRSLGWHHNPRVVPHLLPLLASPNSAVRLASAEALGEIGDPAALAALVERMGGDPQMEVRWQSAKSLGQIRHTDAVPALIAALNDPVPSVRRHAAFALGEIRDRRALNPLHNLLSDGDEGVRRAAVFNIKQIESNSPDY